MRMRPNTWDSVIVDQVLVRNEYNLPKDMQGMVVLDIGAHIGAFAVACAKRGAAKIYCFEPEPENFELLVENVKEYSQAVVFYNAIVADASSSLGLGIRRLGNHDQGLRNTGHVDVFGPADGTAGAPIQPILDKIGNIDMLKVDCEGMEWAIFAAADLSKVQSIEAELHDVSGIEHPSIAVYAREPFQNLCQGLADKLRADGFDVVLTGTGTMELAKLSARRAIKTVVVDRKPVLLWIGDAAVYSGYARVTEQICTRLHSAGWDVRVLGIGYNGDPHRFPYKIYPAVDPNVGGHRNGLSRLKEIIGRVKPDLVVIQDDSWNVGIVIENMAMNNVWVPSVGYVAVDSENVNKAVAAQLRNLKHVICHTQFGVDQLKLAGYTGPVSIAGHGVNSELYAPYDKIEARAGIEIRSYHGKLEDLFLWGVVAANQPRKRLDLSIAYFALWWKLAGKPENAYLYIHTNPDGAYDIPQIADYCGVRNRVIATTGGQRLQEGYLPSLYSALDCMIHTGEGESWGLTALEGMSCGVPQIAVKCGGMPSWAGEGGVYWIDPSVYSFTERIGTKRWIASEKDFVEGMQDMYSNSAIRKLYADYGRNLAESLTWDAVAKHFDQTLGNILRVRKQAVVTDCLAEFE